MGTSVVRSVGRAIMIKHDKKSLEEFGGLGFV
jgi:hypothetical protein